MTLKVRMATGHYCSIAPLVSGEVAPRDFDLEISVIDNPREIFERMHNSSDFDVGEMSISEHIYQTSVRASPFVAIPVAATRLFSHGFFIVNRHSGIRSPKDLEGKRIGVPYYQMSSAVYARGLLQNDYQVDLSRIEWVEGGMEKPGGHGNPIKWPSSPPNLTINDSELSLNELLREGRIDATLGPLLPSDFGRNPDLVRLFGDHEQAEADYYARTGVYSINHVFVVRRTMLNEHPWVAASLFDAFTRAKQKAVARLSGHIRGHWPIPWMEPLMQRIDAVLDGDPWPFGLEANRPTLDAVVRFMHQQGMIVDAPRVEDLFAPGLP